MGKDYYATLGITREAADADIKKAYRTLSLKFHPARNNTPGAAERTSEIAEAYEILSNAALRAVYDKFGEEALKCGVPSGDGSFTKGYVFDGNTERVFRDFFGGDNPFIDFFSMDRNVDVDGHVTFGGLQGRSQPKQDPPVERELSVTLEEVYNGCIKKMKIARKVLNDDGQTTSMREKILTITIKRGWKEGTRITFPHDGDQGPNKIPADIVLVVKDEPHPMYHREGNDLIYEPQIPLVTALTGGAIEIPTLDGRVIRIPITEVVCSGYEKRVVGEGMPLVDDNNQHGDLVIKFTVVFPSVLNQQQKALIRQALAL